MKHSRKNLSVICWKSFERKCSNSNREKCKTCFCITQLRVSDERIRSRRLNLKCIFLNYSLTLWSQWLGIGRKNLFKQDSIQNVVSSISARPHHHNDWESNKRICSNKIQFKMYFLELQPDPIIIMIRNQMKEFFWTRFNSKCIFLNFSLTPSLQWLEIKRKNLFEQDSI